MSGVELRHEMGYVASEDGLPLYWQGIEPADGSRGIVALLHGYTSSSDFLLPMMRHLGQQGLACYSLDYRGHGRSAGPPCHISHFSEYLADARTLFRHVSERADGRKTFLFGNSLGGLIGTLYGLTHPDSLHGAVLTAPFFGPAFRVPRALDACARVVSRVHPRFRLPRQRQDMPEHVTLRWWTETLAAQQVLRREAAKFTVPVLILHGEEDTVACPATAYSRFRDMGSRDKIFGIYPGARHHDLDPSLGPRWWSRVGAWLTRHLETPAEPRSWAAP
jgi:lysophospholipase